MKKEKANGYLLLSTGDVFEGKWFGAPPTGEAVEGEMVFNTGMTGYQEVMTDPSYAGQIVTFTYPLIGNYGISDLDFESVRPALHGIIISELCEEPSHFQAQTSLSELAEQFGISGLYDIDTRALTRLIRQHGELYGKITIDPQEAERCKVDGGFEAKWRTDCVASVSGRVIQTFEPASVGSADAGAVAVDVPHVVLIDFGHKKSICDALLQEGCRVTIVPYDTTAEQIEDLAPDGIVLSNGPGDPKDVSFVLPTIQALADHYPMFGICLGHQLIALAHGCDTVRLPFGHRGSNHPVKEVASGKVYITSQNHGYTVHEDSVPPQEWVVSHRNVNDGSVEGIEHRIKPVSGVQFHPEAHPGPQDTHHLFKRFITQCMSTGEKSYA